MQRRKKARLAPRLFAIHETEAGGQKPIPPIEAGLPASIIF